MLRFKSMPNFRRLAEYESELKGKGATTDVDDHKEVIRLNIYRSSRPDFLTSDEIEQFKSTGIRSIVDFRSPGEYRKATGLKLLDHIYTPNKVKLPLKFRYRPGDQVIYIPVDKHSVHQSDSVLGKHFLIDFFKINYIWSVFNRAPLHIKLCSLFFLIFDVIFSTGYRYFVRIFARHVLNREGLFGQYCDMIHHSQSSICAALKILTDPSNIPALLNCAHGKDRTGIVSALILGCLGKSKADIIADYALSETELEPMRSRLESEIIDQFHMCRTFVTAKAETMAKVVDYIESNYGSIHNYLESIGFTAQEQDLLRKNLMPPTHEE